MKLSLSYAFLIGLLYFQAQSVPLNLSPDFLLGSIRNVTKSATSFLSDSLQKPKDMILQAKDTATVYVSNAVAVPTNMLINAKDATRDYIDSTASKTMELKFKALLESARLMMPYGIPLLDLPILEPLTIDHQDFETTNEEIGNLTASVDNVTISGLSTFVVDHVKIALLDELSLTMNLSIASIQANGIYQISGLFGGLIPIDGNGNFEIETHGTRVYVYVVLGYSGALYVKTLNLDFSIEFLNSYFHGLFKDPEIDSVMNKAVAEAGPELLETMKPELRPQFEEIIARRVNSSVGLLTMRNIIGILTGATDIQSLAHLIKPQVSTVD